MTTSHFDMRVLHRLSVPHATTPAPSMPLPKRNQFPSAPRVLVLCGIIAAVVAAVPLRMVTFVTHLTHVMIQKATLVR